MGFIAWANPPNCKQWDKNFYTNIFILALNVLFYRWNHWLEFFAIKTFSRTLQSCTVSAADMAENQPTGDAGEYISTVTGGTKPLHRFLRGEPKSIGVRQYTAHFSLLFCPFIEMKKLFVGFNFHRILCICWKNIYVLFLCRDLYSLVHCVSLTERSSITFVYIYAFGKRLNPKWLAVHFIILYRCFCAICATTLDWTHDLGIASATL